MSLTEDLDRPQLTPEDAQRVWGISPGMFNSYRSRGQLPASIEQNGNLRITRFSVVQLCQLGIQLDLVQHLNFPQSFAKKLAAEAGVEIKKALLRPSGTPLPNMLQVIVLCDPPRWFPITLNDTVASVDSRAGGDKWVFYDARTIVQAVCEHLITESGKRPEFERWALRWQARGN